MRPIFRKFATLFLVLAVVTSGLGAFVGGVAAETTTLAGDGTDEVTNFNASASDHLEYDLASDDTDFDTDGTTVARLNITYDGEEYVSVSESIDDGTAASYTINVSQDELEKLPGDATESTAVNVTAWGEDSEGNETTTADSFSADVTFNEFRSVRTVHTTNDSIVNNFEAADDDGGLFASLSSFNVFSSTLDSSAELEDTVGVAGTTTDIQVYSEDSDLTDAFDAAAEDANSGDRLGYLMTSTLDGQILRVYNEEPGAKYPGGDNVTETDDTYAVYDGNGQLTVNLGEDRYDADTTEVDMTIVSGEDVGSSALQEDLDYSIFQAWGLSFGSLSETLSDLLPF